MENAIQIQYPITERWVTPAAFDCEYVAAMHSTGRGIICAPVCILIRDLMLAGFCCLFLVGCRSAALGTVSPEIEEQASGLSSSYEKAIDAHATALSTALAAQKLTSEQTLENTHSIMAKLNTLEASLAKSEPQNGKDGDPASAPESPAKANTAATPLKVATPGTSQSETLVELATRLYAQGVNTHMKTREELEAIDAQMKAGQPVTGAMFQNHGTSAVTSKRSAVRFVPRGSGVVQWQNYSTESTCGPNGCPPRRSR